MKRNIQAQDGEGAITDGGQATVANGRRERRGHRCWHCSEEATHRRGGRRSSIIAGEHRFDGVPHRGVLCRRGRGRAAHPPPPPRTPPNFYILFICLFVKSFICLFVISFIHYF